MPYTFNLPPKPDQLEAIGMVAVECAYLESVIDYAIGWLAGVEHLDTLHAMTAHLTARHRLDMMSTLFHLRPDLTESQLKDFASVRAGIEKVLSRRNTVVHSRWIVGEYGSPLLFEIQARGRLKRNRLGMSAPKIREIAEEIALQTTRLHQVLASIS